VTRIQLLRNELRHRLIAAFVRAEEAARGDAAQQFSGALGVAVIGTVFFQWLPRAGWADSTKDIVWVSLACYAISFLVAFLLPKEAREGSELA